MSLPSEIQSHTGLRARSQEAVGGGSKGRPRQEMQQGILLYHVADTQTERDETVTRDRGSGWSCDFGQRGTADIPFLSQNKSKKTNLMNRGGRGDCKKRKKDTGLPQPHEGFVSGLIFRLCSGAFTSLRQHINGLCDVSCQGSRLITRGRLSVPVDPSGFALCA